MSKLSLRGRFIISHILPTLLVVPLVGLALIYILETQVLLADMSEELSANTNLIAEAVSRQPGAFTDTDQAQAVVSGLALYLEGNVFLLGPDGRLLAASDLRPSELQDGQLVLEGIETALGGESSVLVFYNVARLSGEALLPVVDVDEQLVGIVGMTQTLEGVSTQFGRLRNLVLLSILLELILAVILAVFLAARLARPISRVATAVNEIAEGQRIDPVPEEGPQELQALSRSVNSLAERLRSLEDTRRRLLANLVHEIGRPLGALRSAVYTLRQGAGDDPAVRDELLQGMEEEILRMQPLLDDLAQLHGQVLGTLELARQPVNLSEWLPPLLLPWRAAARNKELEWQAMIPEDLPTLQIDPDRLSQAIGNLTSNAIKFTPAGGQVAVSAGADEEEAWIAIQDSGPGIAAEEQEKVFDPFFRSRQQRRFPKGLGLGLTIARDMVEAHGGRLVLESEPGQGSRFTIFLPL